MAGDPWLATVQRLSGPFVQLGVLLNDLKKEVGPRFGWYGKDEAEAIVEVQ